MNIRNTFSNLVLAIRWGLTALLALTSLELFALSSEEIFQRYQTRLYQIKLLDKESDSKSSLGSGFLVGDAFTVATNYHVVADAVAAPDKFRIVYVLDNGKEGELALHDFDIVNDLALLKSNVPLGDPIQIAQQEPKKGAVIFAIGNPHDLGMTVAPGTYNGLTDHAFYERIHFSGSINSGMSGGAVLNQEGEAVGVNVATSGNSISFLVPIEKLNALLASQNSDVSEQSFTERAEKQLVESQQALIDLIFAETWPQDRIGDTVVLGEISEVVSCWGRSSRDQNEENPILEVSRGCSLQDSIYVNRHMTTGSLEYEFYWLEGSQVDERKFFSHLEKNMGGYPGNQVTEEDATEYSCHEGFTTVDGEEVYTDGGLQQAKSFLCARRYKKFPSLYDVLYIRMAKRGSEALISHFTLAGVTQASANKFTQAFVEHVQWP